MTVLRDGRLYVGVTYADATVPNGFPVAARSVSRDRRRLSTSRPPVPLATRSS